MATTSSVSPENPKRFRIISLNFLKRSVLKKSSNSSVCICSENVGLNLDPEIGSTTHLECTQNNSAYIGNCYAKSNDIVSRQCKQTRKNGLLYSLKKRFCFSRSSNCKPSKICSSLAHEIKSETSPNVTYSIKFCTNNKMNINKVSPDNGHPKPGATIATDTTPSVISNDHAYNGTDSQNHYQNISELNASSKLPCSLSSSSNENCGPQDNLLLDDKCLSDEVSCGIDRELDISNVAACTVDDSEMNSSPLPSPNSRSLTFELIQLTKYGWYWGPISREEAEEKLLDQPDGAFLVRDSSADRYLLSLSFRSSGKILHTRIEHSQGLFSFYQQPEHEGFSSIGELVDHSMSSSKSAVFCYSRPRSPGYPAFPVRLTKPISRFTQVRSLQYLCRFVIRQYTSVDNIEKLPLPNTIKGYIQEGQF